MHVAHVRVIHFDGPRPSDTSPVSAAAPATNSKEEITPSHSITSRRVRLQCLKRSDIVIRYQAPNLGDIRRQSPFHGVRRSNEP